MSRLGRSHLGRSGARLLALSLLAGNVLGCRANEDTCKQVAEHIAELAEAEGKSGAGTGVALQRDCNQHRPTRKLVRCMLDAKSLADVDAC